MATQVCQGRKEGRGGERRGGEGREGGREGMERGGEGEELGDRGGEGRRDECIKKLFHALPPCAYYNIVPSSVQCLYAVLPYSIV